MILIYLWLSFLTFITFYDFGVQQRNVDRLFSKINELQQEVDRLNN